MAASRAAETMDLRARQSPVRDQAARGTCTAFGLVALLEALPGVPADLSEQWMYAQAKLDSYVEWPGAATVWRAPAPGAGAGHSVNFFPVSLAFAGRRKRTSGPALD